MKAVIKRELKNYFRNPVLWIGIFVMAYGLYTMLIPYLQIHYFQSDQEIEVLEVESITDADIMEGYIPSTEEEQMQLALEKTQAEMQEQLNMTQQETQTIVDSLSTKNLTIEQVADYLVQQYDFYGVYGVEYYYETSKYQKGNQQDTNTYIGKMLEEQPFSYYFARKFADSCGLYIGFLATILLAFLFIQDSKRDTYELLHTKPVSAAGYVCGKIAGGFLVILFVVVIQLILFGGLCEFYGIRAGFEVHILDLVGMTVVYILPNLLMITCIYAVTTFLFHNPLPALPCMFLYLIYSNMGSIGPDGKYGYYGRPLAIMVRFPGKFFETTPPPLALWNQLFLVIASILLILLAVGIWKRRRVY